MKFVVRPELPTAAPRSSQATLAAVDNSAPLATRRSPLKTRGNVVQTTGATSVLGLLFGQPDRSFYATEMIGLAGVGSGGVQRELARLVQSGLVTVRPVGNQKHYQANPEAPIYAELCGIVRKTFGLAEPLRLALTPLAAQIKCAFVFGSVAKKQDTASSDIDLMVISDSLGYADTFAALEAASTQLGRTVNPRSIRRRN